jgi:hypothetical protein
MKQELDELLCKKYPKLFVNRNADMRTTAMCWGFECGDGWYNIINQLCGNIQHHIDWSVKNNQWDIEYNKKLADMKAGDFTQFEIDSQAWKADYREDMRATMLEQEPRQAREVCPQVTVDQVKEKFGTLRFYYTGGDEYISGLVAMAESMSGVTCEECGNPGKRVGGGWVTTLCKEHAEARDIVYDTEEAEENDI